VANDCPTKISCRDQLLDSAEEVVLRAGLGSLTLDAVAAHAKVSKGGLLYHFPSKDALILALVERTCDNWRSDYIAAIAAEPPGRGRVPRALLKMCMGSTESCSETCRRSSIVLVAAIATNPALAEPLRCAHADLLARLREDGGPTGIGEAVILALNGMWFEQIFGLREMPASRLNAIRDALTVLVDGAGAPAAGRAVPKPAPPPVRASSAVRPSKKKSARTVRSKGKQGIKP
jgi:AcrR family transcriptional regulator